MTAITAEQVRETLVAIVEEYGEDRVYDGSTAATYATPDTALTEDPQPMCIVGHVLHRLAPDFFRDLAAVEGVYSIAYDLYTLQNDPGLTTTNFPDMDARAVRGLIRVQLSHDIGRPWGDFVGVFDHE